MPRAVRRPSGTFRLCCLGPGQLHAPDGRRIPLRTRKHLALLLILGQRPGRPVSRDRVIELLWSEDPERAARHSLSQSVSLINKAVGVDLIGAEAATQLAIAEGALTSDVAEFEAMVRDGRRDEARALWHGTVLDGLWLRRAPAFERWLAEERGRLERLMRRMASDLIEQRRQDGDHVGMRAEAEALLALDPLDEGAMLACLQALTLGGERTQALRRFTEFEKRLKAELDAEPGSGLRGWARRYRKGEAEPVRTPTVSRVHEIQALPAVRPLFGRVDEHRQLWEAWERATSGTGSFWIIEGEAGIGKTALVGTLANQVHVSGASVCFVRCYRTEKSVPFAPISALIRQLARLPGFVAMNPSWIGELTRLVPELKDRFPNAPPPMGVDDSARFRLCDATVHATECVADEQPLLIVVDDIHDADEATLATLHYLGRQVGVWPVMVATSTRRAPYLGSFEADFVNLVRRSSIARFASLERLPDDIIARIAAQELAKSGTNQQYGALPSLVAEARGNPLLAIEACASHCGRPHRSRPAVAGSGDQFSATAISRLRALPPDAARVAECLSLAGRPLAEHELAAVTEQSPAMLAESTMYLREAEFTRQAGTRITLAHDQYAAAIREALPLTQRRGLHQRLAVLMQKGAAGDPSAHFQVAAHLFDAGLAAEAQRHAVSAASFAASLGAVREQAAALELAFSTEQGFSPDLAVKLAECYLEMGNLPALRALRDKAEGDIACSTGNRRSLAFLLLAAELNLGEVTFPSAQERLEALVADECDFDHSPQAIALLVRLSYRLGDARATRQLAKRLRRRINTSPMQLSTAAALEVSAFVAAKLFQPTRALSYLKAALEVASSRHNWALEQQCRAGLGAVLRQLGRFAESERELVRGLALARRTLNKSAEAARLSDIATAKLGLGDFEGAERLLQEAAAIGRAGGPVFAYLLHSNLAEVALLQGRWGVAGERFEYAFREATNLQAWSLQLVTAAGLAICAQRRDDQQALRDWGEHVDFLCRGREMYLHDRWMVDAARAWHVVVTTGDTGAARNILVNGARDLRRRDIDHWLMVRAEACYLSFKSNGSWPDAEREQLLRDAAELEAGGVGRMLAMLAG